MSTTFTISHFTPVADALVKRYGLMTAAVYGRVHRYCKMGTQTCFASLATLADGLNVDRTTIMRHLTTLVEDGYLDDLTPGIRNRPHVYMVTEKLVWSVGLGVAESDTTVAESDTGVAQSNRGVAESDLKKVLRHKSGKK